MLDPDHPDGRDATPSDSDEDSVVTRPKSEASFITAGSRAWMRRFFPPQASTQSLNRPQYSTSLARTTPTFWAVPFERNPHFTGRQSELDQLGKMLFDRDRAAQVAVAGLGGIGKTQLALEFVYHTKFEHPKCSVIWLRATSRKHLRRAFRNAARQLGLSGRHDDSQHSISSVQDYLTKESTGHWLVVVDGADDIDLWFKGRPESRGVRQTRSLMEYLPRSQRGAIVFTTRNKALAIKLARLNVVDLPASSAKEATRLFESHLKNHGPAHNGDESSTLLARLEHLPLAIAQAAMYINAEGISVAEYLSRFTNQEEEKILKLLSEDFAIHGRYPDAENTVARTWTSSFEQIRQSDPLAAQYLSLMACVKSKDIPKSFLPQGDSEKHGASALDTLDSYSFITRSATEDCVDIHPLVHLTARKWLREDGQLRHSTETAIIRLGKVLGAYKYKNRSIWEPRIMHAGYMLSSELVDEDCDHRVELLWHYAECLNFAGQFVEAERAYTQVLGICKKKYGLDHEDTVECAICLAAINRQQGRTQVAEEMLLQVVNVGHQNLGANHFVTLCGQCQLARVYRDQDRLEEADNLFDQVLGVCRSTLGENHYLTLYTREGLASTFFLQGRLKEAETLQLEILEMDKKTHGNDDCTTLYAMAYLAHTWKAQNRIVEAIQLLEDCVRRSQRILGVQQPDYLERAKWLTEWKAEAKGEKSITPPESDEDDKLETSSNSEKIEHEHYAE